MSHLPLELQDILLMIPRRVLAASTVLVMLVLAVLLQTDPSPLTQTFVISVTVCLFSTAFVAGALTSDRAVEIRARHRKAADVEGRAPH